MPGKRKTSPKRVKRKTSPKRVKRKTSPKRVKRKTSPKRVKRKTSPRRKTSPKRVKRKTSPRRKRRMNAGGRDRSFSFEMVDDGRSRDFVPAYDSRMDDPEFGRTPLQTPRSLNREVKSYLYPFTGYLYRGYLNDSLEELISKRFRTKQAAYDFLREECKKYKKELKRGEEFTIRIYRKEGFTERKVYSGVCSTKNYSDQYLYGDDDYSLD